MQEDREQLREDLEAALATLRKDGWCQGSFMNDLGQVCALGAIGKSLRELTGCQVRGYGPYSLLPLLPYPVEREDEAATALWEKLQELHPDLRWSIPLWNDDPETTQQDVENLFEKVIADL